MATTVDVVAAFDTVLTYRTSDENGNDRAYSHALNTLASADRGQAIMLLLLCRIEQINALNNIGQDILRVANNLAKHDNR